MNYAQNHKISQITPSTLIVGIDIAKDKHVARGIKFGKRLVFENRIFGFEKIVDWAQQYAKADEKDHIIFGVEPTGHFWMNLAYYLTAKDYYFVLVNPMY